VVDVADVTPDPRQTAVTAVTVTMSEEIDLSTFDFSDLTLTLNGASVPLDDRVTVAHQSGSSYLISGLEPFTAGQGQYDLKVEAAGITDLWGNAGVGSVFDLWVTDSTPPQSAVQPLTSPATSKSFAITVVGDDVQPAAGVVVSGASFFDVYVSVDQSAFTLWQSLPAANPTATFTGASGHIYGFRSLARDAAGNVESKPIASEAWTLIPDLDAPTTQVDSYTVDPGAALIQLNFSGTDTGGSGLASFQLYVQVDDGLVTSAGTYAAGSPVGGVYSASGVYADVLVDAASHNYRFFTVGVDGRGNAESPAGAPNDVLVAAAFTPPSTLAVTGFDVQKTATQRSYIRYLDVFFNELAGIQKIIDDLQAGTSRIALTRYNLSGQSPVNVPLSSGMLSAQAADLALQVDFGLNGIGGNRNGLEGNGYYKLAIDADDDAEHTLETDLYFYRLAGDVNHDRRIDSLDLSAVNALLAVPPVPYDVNRDGVIDAKDQADADVNGDGAVNSADRLLVMRGRNQSLAPQLPLDD
jgi:hypothetical protein